MLLNTTTDCESWFGNMQFNISIIIIPYLHKPLDISDHEFNLLHHLQSIQ